MSSLPNIYLVTVMSMFVPARVQLYEQTLPPVAGFSNKYADYFTRR